MPITTALQDELTTAIANNKVGKDSLTEQPIFPNTVDPTITVELGKVVVITGYSDFVGGFNSELELEDPNNLDNGEYYVQIDKVLRTTGRSSRSLGSCCPSLAELPSQIVAQVPIAKYTLTAGNPVAILREPGDYTIRVVGIAAVEAQLIVTRKDHPVPTEVNFQCCDDRDFLLRDPVLIDPIVIDEEPVILD